MRIAALSDIHGNLPALEAVQSALATHAVDLVVNLGDLCSGPLWPHATLQALIPLGWPTLAGNHERQLLTEDPQRQGASDRHAHAELGEPEFAWLRSLPATLPTLVPDVACCHGTPSHDLHYLMETVTPGHVRGREPGLRAAHADELAARLGDWAAGGPAVVLCGHSHVPRIAALPGGPLVVNPGSVGLPAYDDAHPMPHVVETGSPHARWALLERDTRGAWHASLQATPYDAEAAARQAERHGRGDWADALRTGRVGRYEADLEARETTAGARA